MALHTERSLTVSATDDTTDGRVEWQFNQKSFPLIWLAGNENGHILPLNQFLGDQKPLFSPKSL